jgi:hypothetical protein
MKLITEHIALSELSQMARNMFGSLVKAVVDIEKEIMVVGGELHADEELFLIEQSSRREYLWGVNLYPGAPKDQLVEFDSMINVRPHLGNRTRGVESAEIRQKILRVVNKLITL